MTNRSREYGPNSFQERRRHPGLSRSARLLFAATLFPFMTQVAGSWGGFEASAQTYGTPTPSLTSGYIGEPAGPLPSGSVGSQRESTPTATPARNPNRPSSGQKPETVPGHIIVTSKSKLTTDRLVSFRNSVSRATRGTSNSAGVNQVDEMPVKLGEKIALVTTIPGQEATVMQEILRQGQGGVSVEPVYRGPMAAAPTDPKYPKQQWEFDALNLPAAYGLEPTMGAGIVMVIADTGIKNMPDMPTVADSDRKNFTSNPIPDDNHGTSTAAIAAELTNNNLLMAGTAGGGVRLLDYKIGINGQWGTTAVILAVTEAIKAGANVMLVNIDGTNLSCTPATKSLMQDAYNAKLVIVAPAGNSGLPNVPQALADCDHVISVGATTKSGTRASFSNYGQNIDVAAPGDGVWGPGSPFPDADGYGPISGTSLSGPKVAGIVALMQKAAGVFRDPQEYENALCSTATKLADFKCGIANAEEAIKKVLSLGPATATPTRTLVPTPTLIPTSTPKPVGQCEPRPRVITRVGKTSDGRLQAVLEVTSNPRFTNELLSIKLGDSKNAEVTVAGSTTPIGPGGQITLSPPGERATLIQRRLTPGSTTVSLTVTDRCGEWKTFFGGGPNAF